MDIKQERAKLQKLVDEVNQITGKEVIWLHDSQQGAGEKNISIRHSDKKGSLWVVPISDGYDIVPSGENWKNSMYEFLRKLCHTNGREVDGKLRWKILDFKIVKKIVYEYSGVKKEKMEQQFREYLENHTELTIATINAYAVALRLSDDFDGVYNAVRDAIEFNNFYEIQDIGSFLEQYELIENIIPNKNNTNGNGNDNGNLSAALRKYQSFLETLGQNTNTQGNENMIDEKLQEKIDLLEHKKQIILQGSPGTGKTRKAKEISYNLITGKLLSGKEEKRRKQLKEIENQVNFLDYLKKGKYKTTEGGTEFEVIELRANYIGVENIQGNFYTYGKEILLEKSNTTYGRNLARIIHKELAKNKGSYDNFCQYKLIQFHPAYSYEDFVRGIVATTIDGMVNYEVQNKVLAEMAENAIGNPDEKFVLIIDEINRANLAAVLGELIYALEYRGEEVESVYGIDGDRKIILPENLYIIGTMNTADRSVGHIDYAIRRRFAFVNVDTDESVIPENAQTLFSAVKTLFDEKLSEEFEKNDVMIGHSYFLNDIKIALEYEIKPILHEYRKDGVLNCEKTDIDSLNVD